MNIAEYWQNANREISQHCSETFITTGVLYPNWHTHTSITAGILGMYSLSIWRSNHIYGEDQTPIRQIVFLAEKCPWFQSPAWSHETKSQLYARAGLSSGIWQLVICWQQKETNFKAFIDHCVKWLRWCGWLTAMTDFDVSVGQGGKTVQ